MRFRWKLTLVFSCILVAALAAMTLLLSFMGQRDNQERFVAEVSAMARNIAALRAATDDGLADPTLFLSSLEAMLHQEGISAWLVDPRGFILPPDILIGEGDMTPRSGESIEMAFSAADLEQYVTLALGGESIMVTGSTGERMERFNATAIEPVVYADGSIRFVLFVNKSVDEMRRGEVFMIWRQAALSALGAASLGIALLLLAGGRLARPIEIMAARYAGAAKGENELEQLNRTLLSMHEQIRDLEELRRGFVSNVSHELRAPLTNIVGYLQGIADGAAEGEESGRYLRVALEEAKRMSALIGDLLNLSRLESGRFELRCQAFDICELLRRALVAHANAIEEKDIRLTVDLREEAILVYADPQWIRQAVENILGNAVKFVGEGGGIALRAQRVQDRAYVTVADDGPGIGVQDLPHVFEWFYTADKAHSMRGTGLGLAIARSIIDRHGQAVRVASEPGRGTIVTFSLALHS